MNYGAIYLSPPEHWLKYQTPLSERLLVNNDTMIVGIGFTIIHPPHTDILESLYTI